MSLMSRHGFENVSGRAFGTVCNQMKQPTDKIDQVVSALLTCPRVDEAAQQCHMSRTTLWRVTQLPNFRHRFREARIRLSQDIVTSLQANSLEAISTLRNVMRSKDTPASVKVAAAGKLLELSLRAKHQLETEERIGALEAMLKQRWTYKNNTKH